jgi:hypothetical protein
MKRRKVMQRHTVAQTALFIFVTMFGLIPLPVAKAAQCSNVGIAGAWGFTSTGEVALPTGAIPFGAVGRLSFDAAGNIAGTQTASANGNTTFEKIKGTITVSPNCTASATVSVFEGGALVRTTALRAVFVDSQTKFRVIFSKVTLPTGGNLPVVITIEGDRLF